MGSSKTVVLRRSKREVKLAKSFSPERTIRDRSLMEKIKPKKHKASFDVSSCSQDVTVIEKLALCHHCNMPLMYKQAIKAKKRLKTVQETKWGSEKVKTPMPCSFCRSTSKNQKNRVKKNIPSNESKEAYLKEAENFASSLADTLKDSDAKRLFCPEFKTQPCGCLQKWILGEANSEKSYKRAQHLLQLLKEAKNLSLLKYYDIHEVQNQCRKGLRKTIGVGNGHKRSIQFEKFVLHQRHYLKREMHMCERACQKVLMYSNNFLHKKLKTEPEKIRRVQRSKGKAALGLLMPITELPIMYCCKNHCALMAITHKVLLEQWREQASSGQAEARRIIAEMLTPSGLTSNCFKFVSWVTGCSFSTISKVQDQIYATGGDREPPEHGLKKYWQEQLKGIPPPGSKSTFNSLAEYTDGNCSLSQCSRPALPVGIALPNYAIDQKLNEIHNSDVKRIGNRKQKQLSEIQVTNVPNADAELLNSNLRNVILIQPSSETSVTTASLAGSIFTSSTSVESSGISPNPQINETVVTTWSLSSLPSDNSIRLPQNVIFSFSHVPTKNVQQEQHLLNGFSLPKLSE